MGDVTNIPQVFDTRNPARLAAQLRSFATQVQQVARKVSYEGAIYVWDKGCLTVPTNTTEAGAEEIVFKSGYAGKCTLIITVVGAEGGVTASLNGTNLGTMSDVDTSSEIAYEFFDDGLIDTDNPLNSFKIWSTTGDSAELRRLEVWRNHVYDAIDSVTTLADTTATNFNGRNDRDGSAITAPVVAGDGTAIDHVLNTDSTSTISFEWTWGGTESDIDGFVVYVRESSSGTSYNIGDTPAEETLYYAPADKRAFFLQGVATDNHYTFGVAAYRIVDPDVDSSGIIYSSIVQPALGAEDPYQPSSSIAFQGDITGTINGTAASAVSSAVTNFNSRNDRDGSSITDPVIAADGTAVDHVANDDGSVDITFEWSWGGTESDIDGFIIHKRVSSSASSYNFGTTAAEEDQYVIPANKRAIFLFGVAANKYYTLGVQAYRVVDPDIDASGLIKSNIVQCSLGGEDPYQPASSPEFAGDVTGTIDGTAASDVNQWSKISDDAPSTNPKPEDGATRSLNTDNLIRNPGAEDNSFSPHSESGGGGTWAIGATTKSGDYSFRHHSDGQSATATLSMNGAISDPLTGIPVIEDEQFKFEIWYRYTTGTPNRVQVVLSWRESDGTFISQSVSSQVTPTTSYQKLSVAGTAPATAAFVRPIVNVVNDSNTGFIHFDDARCVQLRTTRDLVDNAATEVFNAEADGAVAFDSSDGADTLISDTLSNPTGGKLFIIGKASLDANVSGISVFHLIATENSTDYILDTMFVEDGNKNYTFNAEFTPDGQYSVVLKIVVPSTFTGGGIGGGLGGSLVDMDGDAYDLRITAHEAKIA